jgi:hypothetical protein
MRTLFFNQAKTQIKIVGFEKGVENLIDETYRKYAEDIRTLWGFKPKLTLNIQPVKYFVDAFRNIPTIVATLIFNLLMISLFILIARRSVTVINFISSACVAIIILAINSFVIFISVRRWNGSLGWTTFGLFKVVTFLNVPKNLAEGPDGIASTVSHELVHAYTKSLNLPLWLDEGLAYLTPVKLGISPESTYTIERFKNPPLGRRKERIERDEDYWVAKYLNEVHRSILMQTISKKRQKKQYEKYIKRQLGIRKKLRIKLGELAYEYYENKTRA